MYVFYVPALGFHEIIVCAVVSECSTRSEGKEAFKG